MTTAPWDYTEAPQQGEPTREIVPTPEGRALGASLARLVDEEEPRLLAIFAEHGLELAPRCSDCALRAGTTPNGCVETLMDVIKCSVEQKQFWCHKGVSDGSSPKTLCRGALVLSSGGSAARAAFIEKIRADVAAADGRRRDRNRRKAQRRKGRAA